MKGSYLLVLQLTQPVAALQIGRLGRFDFPPGHYLYVGSAFGPGGIAARLAYHRRRDKQRPHWHLDYLRPHARLREAWTIAGPVPLECAWCARLAVAPDVSRPVPGFGSRDTGCPAHLFYLQRQPHPTMLTGLLLGPLAGDQPAELLIEVHSYDDP